MAKSIINLSINVDKIDQKKLFVSKSGARYLSLTVMLNTEKDKYGNNGFIVESTTKAEREKGLKGTIVGNAKIYESDGVQNSIPQNAGSNSIFPIGQQQSTNIASASDDLPF